MSRPPVYYPPAGFDLDRAADYLSISVRALDELQRQGHIIPKKLGSRRVYLRKDLEDYLERLPDWERKGST